MDSIEPKTYANVEKYIDGCVKKNICEILNGHILEAYSETIRQEIVKAISKMLGQMINLPLSVKQVACITGKSEQSIYKMCQRDQIRYTKLGNLIYINLKDLNNTFIMSDFD